MLERLLAQPRDDQERGIRAWVEHTARTFELVQLAKAAVDPKFRAIAEAAVARLKVRSSVTAPLGGADAAALKNTEEPLLEAGFRRR